LANIASSPAVQCDEAQLAEPRPGDDHFAANRHRIGAPHDPHRGVDDVNTLRPPDRSRASPK
jgi:hypothetical protein